MSILDVTALCYQSSETWDLAIRSAGSAALLVVLACWVARWLSSSSAAACTCYWEAVLGGLLLLGCATAATAALRAHSAAGRTLLAVWIAGAAAVLLARATVAALRVVWLWLSRPVDDRGVSNLFQRVAADLGIARSARRPVEVRVSALTGRFAPRGFFFWRARVLLPSEALRAPSAELRIWAFDVLALARTQRMWSRALAAATAALWWFHPLVWYALQRFLREQRRAADALAVSCGASADDYAQFVWDHHNSTWMGRWVSAARRLLFRRDPCELRVLALVGEPAGCCHHGLARAAAAAGLLLVVTGLAASFTVLGRGDSQSPVATRETRVADAPAARAPGAKCVTAPSEVVLGPITSRRTITASRYDLEHEAFERWSRLGRASLASANAFELGKVAATADLAGRVNEP